MYGVEPFFLQKLFLILAIFGVLLFLFNTVMRRLLKVKKKRFFSYNHLNDKHKIIDWTIRITFIVVLLFGYMFNSARASIERIWFLETYFLLFVFIIATETVRAFMEWKYEANRKAYIFTISQLMFVTILLLSLFTTEFFGWFG